MSPFATPYRDDSLGADLRYADLLIERRRELPMALAWSAVRERRVARIAAGAVGLAGAGLMILRAAAVALDPKHRVVGLTHLLLGSVVAMVIAYALGRVGAKLFYSRPAIPSRSRDPRLDELKLESPLCSQDAWDQADRRELWSVALPLMAIALLAPLTIHALVYGALLAYQGSLASNVADFNTWVALSLLIVGHAHLVLAFLSYRFAKKLRELPTVELEQKGGQLGWNAFWWTVFVSAVPGALLYLIPPLLTLFTGLLFSPAAFRFMRRRVMAEREALRI